MDVWKCARWMQSNIQKVQIAWVAARARVRLFVANYALLHCTLVAVLRFLFFSLCSVCFRGFVCGVLWCIRIRRAATRRRDQKWFIKRKLVQSVAGARAFTRASIRADSSRSSTRWFSLFYTQAADRRHLETHNYWLLNNIVWPLFGCLAVALISRLYAISAMMNCTRLRHYQLPLSLLLRFVRADEWENEKKKCRDAQLRNWCVPDFNVLLKYHNRKSPPFRRTQ